MRRCLALGRLVESMRKQTTGGRVGAGRQFESLAQAADRTGLSTYTLRRRIADGRLPAYRSGSRIIRVDPDDVNKLLTRIPTAFRQG